MSGNFPGKTEGEQALFAATVGSPQGGVRPIGWNRMEPEAVPVLVDLDAAGKPKSLNLASGPRVGDFWRAASSRGVYRGLPFLTLASGWGADGSGTISQSSAGLVLTKTAAGGYIMARRYGESIKLRADSVITLEATLSGVTAGTILRIAMSSDGYVNKSLLLEHVVKAAHGPKLRIAFPVGSATLNGGELVTNTMTYVAVHLADASATASVTVESIRYNEGDRPRLIIDFDDGFLSQYTEVFRLLTAADLRGNIAVIGSEVGKAGYVTEAQLQEMYEAGWDLMVHGFDTHTTLASYEAVYADVRLNKRYLQDRGFTRAVEHYVYPGGIVAAYSRKALADNAMVTGRLVDENLTPTTGGFTTTEATGLWSFDISQNRGTAALLAAVDRAIAAKASIRLHGHRVVGTVVDAGNELTVADFTTLVTGLRERVRDRLIDNCTISEWWDLVGN